MSYHRARIAWPLAAVTMALFVAGVTVLRVPSSGQVADAFLGVLVVGSFATVGAVIASHRPQSPIGWIFSAMAFLFTLALISGSYAQHGLISDPGSLPGAPTAAWIGNFIWPVAISPIGFFMLLFPDGRSPSRRWRWVGWALALGLTGWVVSQALRPGPLVNAGYGSVENPYGVSALGDLPAVLGGISGFLLFGGTLAAGVSIVARFRRSRGDERRQLKWVAYAGGVLAFVALIEIPSEGILEESDSFVRVFQFALTLALSALPVAAGMAILKYRLYDIDLIVNRTLVYGALSLLLGLLYVAGVFGLGALLRSLTGQEDNGLAVAGSTLGVAGLFRPARARIQSFIDRRFYRARYDAARTLEAFSTRLRDEVDLDALTVDLLSVVQTTLQPAHVFLWMRGDRR